ncbi:efflux RND transporter periplasmic adaptor subunit [Paenibacillus turpanensis]|uniref:efflux RND transporter periplasmic adaptor subunit n=1 Tax=Paenibacillus turpanensis TaxID=2689078 RepID=UPI001409155B|nr:efflux RND transporter periplasmic adaptor subunit [Paenibacillus turpanensis]
MKRTGHVKQWIPAVLVLTTAAMLQGCGLTDASTGAEGSAVPVQTIKLSSAAADAGFSGKVIPDQEVKVVSKVSGRVASVVAEEGAKVKKGDVLLQLEKEDLEKQLRQAEAALVAAKAKLADVRNGARQQELDAAASALKQAQAGLASASAVVEQAESGYRLATNIYNQLRNQYDSTSAVTRDDLERGTFEFDKAKAGYEQALAGKQSAEAAVAAAQAKLDLTKAGATENTVIAMEAEVERLTATAELAQSALDHTAITAPIDGIVVKRSVSAGEMAQAGTTVLSLVNMDRVQVELSVMENQIGKLQAGAAVTVSVQNVPNETFPGTITFVSPVSNANSTTFPVKVTVDNAKGLLFAGMIAQVHVSDAAQAQLEVPSSALVTRDGKTYLVSVIDGKAHYVEVTAKEKSPSLAYVRASGLTASSRIVVQPTDSITEGTPLKAE